MIEIWTEDSTAGYRFLKKINKVIYNNQLVIIPHSGIGDTHPTKSAIYGGVLYHLKRHTGNNLVLLYIDKAIDIQDTAENYSQIIREARKHTNIKIIEQVCFEVGLLSYKSIFKISGNSRNDLYKINQEFVELSKNLVNFRPHKFSALLKAYIKSKCGRRKQYEHVAKIILSDITTVNTQYGGKPHNLSLISGGKIGACWMKDCCIIPNQYICSKKCKIKPMCLDEKINDIVINSMIHDIIKQINAFIDEYMQNNYRAEDYNEINYEYAYYTRYSNNMKIKHVGRIMEVFNYWNYERLYRFKY